MPDEDHVTERPCFTLALVLNRLDPSCGGHPHFSFEVSSAPPPAVRVAGQTDSTYYLAANGTQVATPVTTNSRDVLRLDITTTTTMSNRRGLWVA